MICPVLIAGRKEADIETSGGVARDAAKNRALADKRMTAVEVVERFIPDACILADGGFDGRASFQFPFHLWR